MKTKRIALLLSVLMVFGLFLAACGDKTEPDNGESSDDNGEDTITIIDIPWEDDRSNTLDPVPAGAVDFSDGKIDWLAANTSPGDADPFEFYVIDFNGAKALKIEVKENKNPYLGIDISSLLGDDVAKVRKIGMRIWTEHPDGTFYATSGILEVYTGEDNEMSEFLWGVAVERSNPRVLTAELEAGETFAPGANNILILKKDGARGDNAVIAGDRAANIIIDYIAFYDGSGSVIAANTSAGFDPPKTFGAADSSLLFEVTGEVTLDFLDDGATGSSSGWGQAGKIDDIDLVLDHLIPGSIITVHYRSEKAPEIIFQSWSGGPEGWGKVVPFTTNLSGNIVQFRYEDIVEGFGTDNFEEYLDRVNVGDWGVDLSVVKVTIGQRVEDVPWKPYLAGHDGYYNVTGWNESAVLASEGFSSMRSDNAWSLNFRLNTNVPVPGRDDFIPGPFKHEWLVEGAYFIINYESEGGAQWCFQTIATDDYLEKWVGAESDICRVPEKGIDQLSVEEAIVKWGSDDFSGLNAIWTQNRNEPMSVIRVAFYTPYVDDDDE